ncbi:SURF1 family protein [Gryllotalpicola reticulitermitis]|uniref:SURF1-like protein n=1 Tax=Gryllotalpicola reticulitermitis TaxID=1184153 RepID=A0ABV8Q8M8_9MICO
MPERYPQGSLQHRGSRAVEARRPGALERKTAAVYDTTTEGMVGYEFVRTRRWVVYIIAAVVFAVACVFLSHWQLDRGQKATSYNARVQENFNADPVPLDSALPKLDSYRFADDYKRVSVTGTYLPDQQLVVRTRPCGDDTGFEILTPLRLTSGKVFVIDRGCVDASNADPDLPKPVAAPPSGTVSLIARLQPSEAKRGSTPAIKNQIETIDLPQVKQRIGGSVYTGAYGLLQTQTPASKALGAVVTSAPTANTAIHWSYMVQWVLFAIGGFVALYYAVQVEFRRINADDPEERVRARNRREKAARKKFTDGEIEDELLDGFVPMSRWGIEGPVAIAPPGAGPKFALDEASAGEPTQAAPKRASHDVIVIQPSDDEPKPEE